MITSDKLREDRKAKWKSWDKSLCMPEPCLALIFPAAAFADLSQTTTLSNSSPTDLNLDTGATAGSGGDLQFSSRMVAFRWILVGCFALLQLPFAVMADSLDEIKADLASCKNCRQRTLLEARLNYRLKMVQDSETTTAGIAGSVPGTSSGARRMTAGAAGSMASNAGAGSGNPIPTTSAAENAPLRGQTAMSAYVSVYNTSDVNAAELRLSIEQQFRELGINVLGHTAPPSYPVFNLVIREASSSRTSTTSTYDPSQPAGQRNQTKTITVPTVTYEVSAELRRLVPGTTTANNPIRDEAIWKVSAKGESGQLGSVAIADDALKLAIGFVDAWASVNPKLPATVFKPKPPITPGPPPETNHPEIVLLHETVQSLFQGATDSIYDVSESQRAMVQKQITDLAAGGQKVLTCQYGPLNARTPEGFKDYSFWYPVPPAKVVNYILSTYAHPFMRLGLISITKCPPTAAGAEQIFRQRFN